MGKTICGLLQLRDKGATFILKKKNILIIFLDLLGLVFLNFKIL